MIQYVLTAMFLAPAHFKVTVYCMIHVTATLIHLYQGERGAQGEPGPRGPYGLPVSLMRMLSC